MKKILLLLLLPAFVFGQVNTFPWVNDFESFIALEQDPNDDGDWTLWQGPTNSIATGPSGDHTTGSGIYYYIESSNPNYPNKTFITYTPTFDVSATPGKVLSFWYHMYGNAMGDLEIGVLDASYTLLDVISGNQGDEWHFAYYPINSVDSFKIQFKGITGSLYTSDICIDDVMISDPFAIGCMDTAALNYDATVIVDDGSCTYPPCGGFINSNAYQQCWASQSAIVFEWWSDVTSLNCNVVKVHFGDDNGLSQMYGGSWLASNGYNNFAVAAGPGQMPPNWSLEHYLVLEYEDGGFSDTIFYTPTPCIPGCTDSTQQSYNPWATTNDGSCSGTTCDTATQYQITMEVVLDNWPGETSWIMNSAGIIGEVTTNTYNFNDIGQTFTYDFCVDQNAGFELILNDSYGDGLAGSTSGGTLDGNVTIYDCSGNVIWSLPDPNFGNVAYSGPQSATPCPALPIILGCTDNDYQEYDPLANVDNGSCMNLHVYGCTNDTMFNYDSSATIMDLIPDCNYTLILEDDAGDGWGNSFLGLSQGNMSWTFTMGPGPYNQSFPLTLDSDKSIKVYYFEVGGPQTPPEEVQFQTWHNSFYLINSLQDTLLAEGTNPFASNGQGALQAFETPFWVTYAAMPSCGNYCEPFIEGCMDTLAYNYSGLANTSNTCYYNPGCMNSAYLEYYTQGFVADTNNGSCLTQAVWGCTDITAFNYNSLANVDNGGCIAVILGCMNPLAFNYNSNANTADTCIQVVYGCMSSIALNYNSLANTDDGSCINIVLGCMDATAFNFNINANVSDNSCVPVIIGCTDATALNYDLTANTNNGCIYSILGCTDPSAFNFNINANTDDGSCIAVVYGCTDSTAYNYNVSANTNVGCVSFVYGCTDANAYNYNSSANTDDGSCIAVVIGCNDITALNYDSIANVNFGCIYPILGCTDINAFNYNPNANVDDSACVDVAIGCTDPTALNYDTIANTNSGCIYPLLGCTNPLAFNFNTNANTDDGSCIPVTIGCTDPTALNYNSTANTNSGCVYPAYGCTDPSAFNYNVNANTDDGSCMPVIYGCLDNTMYNYDANANTDNNSCISFAYGCTDQLNLITTL